MYEYTHGGNIYDKDGFLKKNVIDFSTNVNPFGMPDGVMTATISSLAQSNVYPDSYCRLLTSNIAEFENVGKDNIFCSNGASDILFRLAYAVRPEKVLVVTPSFADYERIGEAVGAKIIYYPLQKENGFVIDKDIADVITSSVPEIVFVCNPNNPTGILTDIEMMTMIASACKSVNSVMLADECFLDFTLDPHNHSVKSLIGEYRNIVILKAFTKIFAMPGLRLGYAICSDKVLIDRMRFHGADWSVSNTAQAAGIAALENCREYIDMSVAYINSERKKMMREFVDIGLTVYPSQADFIFFHCSWSVRAAGSIDLCDELRKKNIIIRDCANFKGLDTGYYRTAVLSEEKNKLLTEAIKGVKMKWQNQ